MVAGEGCECLHKHRTLIGYILAWVGMDAQTFLNVQAKPLEPTAVDWSLAILNTVFGAVLLWGIAGSLKECGTRVSSRLTDWPSFRTSSISIL
jgi:hypothetical protein